MEEKNIQSLNNGWSPARVSGELVIRNIWQKSDWVDRWWLTGVDTRRRDSVRQISHAGVRSDSKIIYSLCRVA